MKKKFIRIVIENHIQRGEWIEKIPIESFHTMERDINKYVSDLTPIWYHLDENHIELIEED